MRMSTEVFGAGCSSVLGRDLEAKRSKARRHRASLAAASWIQVCDFAQFRATCCEHSQTQAN